MGPKHPGAGPERLRTEDSEDTGVGWEGGAEPCEGKVEEKRDEGRGRERQGASRSQPQLGSSAARRLTVGSFWSITGQAFTRRCQALLWRGPQADEKRRAEVRSWQGPQSSSPGAPGRGAKKGGCKGNRVSPGLIGHQAYPRSYLPLQPSPAPLSGTLLGIMSVWASVCLPRPQPKFLGVEGLGGQAPPRTRELPVERKTWAGRLPQDSGTGLGRLQWQKKAGEAGQRSGQQQRMSPPPYTLSLAGLPHLRALAPCTLPCL